MALINICATPSIGLQPFSGSLIQIFNKVVSESCVLDFRIFCLLLVTRAAVASVRSPKVCALEMKTAIILPNYKFWIKLFFYLLRAHVWNLCTFVNICDKNIYITKNTFTRGNVEFQPMQEWPELRKPCLQTQR